jgi:catechol-2,3-dioxygenase
MTDATPAVSFSHFGIFVYDLEKMTRFYTEVVGLVETDRGMARGRPIVFLSRELTEHHQFVLVEGRTGKPDDRVINQISLRVGSLDDLRAFKARLEAHSDATDLDPINHGVSWSLYFRDPEGNRVELFLDTPWYVKQPRVEPLDLSLDDEAIAAATREQISKEEGFEPIEEWRARFEKKLAARGGAG